MQSGLALWNMGGRKGSVRKRGRNEKGEKEEKEERIASVPALDIRHFLRPSPIHQLNRNTERI